MGYSPWDLKELDMTKQLHWFLKFYKYKLLYVFIVDRSITFCIIIPDWTSSLFSLFSLFLLRNEELADKYTL